MRMQSAIKNIFLCLVLSASFWTLNAAATPKIIIDKTTLISQQTDLLKNRLIETLNQFQNLQQQDDKQYLDLIAQHTIKELRNQASLDISVAKSNLDSINIELSESQQSVTQLNQDIDEISSQLNASSIFGRKLARPDIVNTPGLQQELTNKKTLLTLEKERESYLLQLQKLSDNALQLQKAKYARINVLLKSRTMMRLQASLAQSEIDFQQQQSVWMQQLNILYGQLNKMEAAPIADKTAHTDLQREIFYANENLNFAYLHMLIVRYSDQLQQLQVAISHSRSITLLNKANDEVQGLTKQLERVKDLLRDRTKILQKRNAFLSRDKQPNSIDQADLAKLKTLSEQYQVISVSVANLQIKLQAFRETLSGALQYELSSRQGMPGFNLKSWIDIGAEIMLVPTLAFEVAKTLTYSVVSVINNISLGAAFVIGLIEFGLILIFTIANKLFSKLISRMSEQELGHVNLKRLCVQLLQRNLIDIFMIGNVVAFFFYYKIPQDSSIFVINLLMVWLFFKVIITMARICLVETAHDRAGHDVILYHRLKWSFLVGGIITVMTVFMNQLPVVYEIKDLFDRLFLLFLLVVSVFLLKSWDIVPALILTHIDDRRLYLKKVVRLLGLMIPIILFVNSAIGLFGFVNLVLTVSWYESVFVLVLVGYLIVRGLLIDGMMLLSSLMIRHIVNGWLWTEAFLKPADKVLRIAVFFAAWVILFALYGWNWQSPVVMHINSLLNYQLVSLLGTSLTPLSMIELGVVVSFLFWAARWTREFVYRALSSRTKDMGLRNSIAIFSQYTTIVIGIFVCLRVLGIDFKALAVVAGAFAFGVGLGLRDLFNNFACGFLLLIERPVRVGDTVTINQYEGEVIHIGARAITVRTWDHMEVLVPNAEIFTNSFTNWTAKDSIIRSVFPIKINRHDSPADVQTLIHQVLAKQKDVLTDPSPEVFLRELSDSLIEFEVRYFINLRQIRSRQGLRSEVLMAIWDAFEKHGVQPPYPQHEVHVKGNLPEGIEKLLAPAIFGD
jgi:potassium efflux system protein